MHGFFDLSGKNALVVGGAGGIGFGIVKAFADFGATVVSIDNSPDQLPKFDQLLSNGNNVASIEIDIAERSGIEQSLAQAEDFFGSGVDILVNSAGIQRRNLSHDFSVSDWDDVIEVNLTAAFLYSKHCSRSMINKGYGKIINISSIMSNFGGITIPAYAASKGGLTQLTKAFSNDLAMYGICVNAIAPGYIETNMNVNLASNSKRSSEILLRTPMGRWGKPEDLQGAAIYLASHASDFVTGSVITVDGGYSAR